MEVDMTIKSVLKRIVKKPIKTIVKEVQAEEKAIEQVNEDRIKLVADYIEVLEKANEELEARIELITELVITQHQKVKKSDISNMPLSMLPLCEIILELVV
jgi:hypothetical protein